MFVLQRSVVEQGDCVSRVKQELQELRSILEVELAKEELSGLQVSLESLRQQVAMTQSLRDHLGKNSITHYQFADYMYSDCFLYFWQNEKIGIADRLGTEP